MGLVKYLLVRFLKGNWGRIIPTLFKAIAEGQFGEPIKKIYWWMAGKKTASGAILMAVGAGLETICANFPDYTWACPVSRWLYVVGGFLASVGLVDGGTRAPWPDGTPKEP